MEYNKLYAILKTLTKEEISEFKRFINSPFYNQNPNVPKLFSEISTYHPDYNSLNLKGEKLHEIIFPGTDVNKGSINNLITKLISLAEKYLAVRAFDKNETISVRLLLQEYEKRKLDALFISAINKALSKETNKMTQEVLELQQMTNKALQNAHTNQEQK